jgi:hypothetical protein
MKVVKLPALCTDRLYSQKTFLILISAGGRVDPSSAGGMNNSMKYSFDTIGNKFRDFPIDNAVPQSTAPPRLSIIHSVLNTELEKTGRKMSVVHFKELPEFACRD